MTIDYTNYDSLGLNQWEGSELELRDGVMERIATNGKVRTRALQSDTKYDPVVEHGMLTNAQVDDFLSFYNGVGQGGRTRTFLFTSTEDSVQRTVVFRPGRPYRLRRRRDGLHTLTVYLRHV